MATVGIKWLTAAMWHIFKELFANCNTSKAGQIGYCRTNHRPIIQKTTDPVPSSQNKTTDNRATATIRCVWVNSTPGDIPHQSHSHLMTMININDNTPHGKFGRHNLLTVKSPVKPAHFSIR